MADPVRESDGYYHPASEDKVAALIRHAARQRLQLRVRGSMHSVPAAVTTDGFRGAADPGRNIDVKLDRLAGVTFHDDGSVRVGAGCHLGRDPLDPASTDADGLLHQLDARGSALDDIGGITHQTVSGFLSTGSAGGSLKYSVEDNIAGIRLVDGLGNVVELDPSQDEFNGAAVAMGLVGVVVEVTFKPTVRYCIEGKEAISTVEDCAIDLFGPGAGSRPSLANFLRETDYARLMWWPQPQVDKVAVWEARRVPWSVDFKPKEYQEIGGPGLPLTALPRELLGLLSRIAGSVVRHLPDLIDCSKPHGRDLLRSLWATMSPALEDLRNLEFSRAANSLTSHALQFVINLYFNVIGNRAAGGLAQRMFREIFTDEETFQTKWSPLLMNSLFLVADNDKGGAHRGKPQVFRDFGHTGLPMDNQISDRLMPTEFTELWIPIGQTQAVMNDLRDFYATGGYASTGTYACEIYGARRSNYWLSPAHGQDVVRIDVFWFGRNSERPDKAYYPMFWDLLAKHEFRPHWGKYLPPAGGATGVDYLRRNYPRWNDFMRLRARYDPAQIFVTDYWRSHLGVAPGPEPA